MYHILADQLGNIIGFSREPFPDSFVVEDQSELGTPLYALDGTPSTEPVANSNGYSADVVEAALSDYKFLNGGVVYMPRPHLYSVWNGTAWVDDPDLLAETKTNIVADLFQYRGKILLGGFKVGNHWFESDTDNKFRYVGMVLDGANLPPVQWETMTQEYITITPPLAVQIFQAYQVFELTVFAVHRQHLANIAASTDPLAYDYTTGWPAVYVPGG